jgi:hypothetical protein
VDQVAHEAGVVRLPARERLGEQGHPHRTGPPDRGRDGRGCPAVRHQADPRERQQERRRRRGDDQVAGERDRAAGAGGHPADGGDAGLGQRDDRPHDPVDPVEGLGAERLVAAVGTGARDDVGARAERATCAGQEHDPYVVAVRRLLEGVGEQVGHRPGHRIQPVRAVEGHPEHAALQVDVETVAHAPTLAAPFQQF